MRRTNGACHIIFALCSLVLGLMLKAQTTSFHNAPASAKDLKPLADIDRLDSARQSYERSCASCHGVSGQGTGNVPSLTTATIKSASPGELVWFISKGDPNDGMPSWAQLPEKQRW
jgi:mono/diheme cytochrome c family protein